MGPSPELPSRTGAAGGTGYERNENKPKPTAWEYPYRVTFPIAVKEGDEVRDIDITISIRAETELSAADKFERALQRLVDGDTE